MKRIFISTVLFFASFALSATEYHVSVKGDNRNSGSIEKPLRTIQAAAEKAYPGDIITVHEGVYREWINPPRGGSDQRNRITYRAAQGEKVKIKGSEQVTGWAKQENGTWKVILPNSFFSGFNPFEVEVEGDWYHPLQKNHTGEVYLDGLSLYERDSLYKVADSKPITTLRDPNGSRAFWYSEVDSESTTIWANFGDADPNKELVEVNARATCFYPSKEGIDYITVSGFHFSQAAAQWAAPTAQQIGLIATHWNKGWIIENNVISNAKCSGITLGKERGTGHDVWSGNQAKDGAVHYIEVVLRALKHGWNKENIGSHIVRNNEIFHCEQTAMCGSMGAAFSEVYGNYIHDIWVKRLFTGAEIAGIKFHGAIDTWIHHNRINNAGKGIWLDWMTQGVRVSNNLFYDNSQQDLFIEVNHGPFIVDNNISLSKTSLLADSEGGAFVHNLFAGSIIGKDEPYRFTPYHFPHSTEIMGLSPILAGDMRFYNNIFIGQGDDMSEGDENLSGLISYNKARQKIWTGGNLYCNGAKPYKGENDYSNDESFNPNVQIEERGREVWLKFNMEGFKGEIPQTQIITTELLGKTTTSEAIFDNVDGSHYVIDKDYFNQERSRTTPFPGSFEFLDKSQTRIKIWQSQNVGK